MTGPADKCGRCWFCGLGTNEVGDVVDMCRRYAPRPEWGYGVTAPNWPAISPQVDWCGEFQAVPQAAVERVPLSAVSASRRPKKLTSGQQNAVTGAGRRND